MASYKERKYPRGGGDDDDDERRVSPTRSPKKTTSPRKKARAANAGDEGLRPLSYTAGRMDSYRVATKNVKPVRSDKPRRKEFDDNADYRSEVEYDEHHVPLDELFRRFGTDPHKGLSDDQAGQFIEAEGPNILTPPHRSSECAKLTRSFFGGFSILLIVGALLCYIAYIITWWTYEFPPFENLYLGIALTVAIVVTGLFTYYHESRNNRVMDMFQKMIPQQTSVVRDGNKKSVRSEDLVVGDIVYIQSGDRIPADIRILTAQAFKVDNSSLTGESEPQTRSPEYTNENALETRNLAFFGTNAIEGSCTGLVIRTGDITYMGRISRIVAAMDARDTPMGKEITRLLHILTTIAIILGVIFFIATFALQYYWLDALIFAIGLIIANLPEGLFAIVTVCLTLTAKRMAKKNCLVKNLQAIEALGATSTICSDKTGTLTQNSMSVSHVWFDSRIHVGHSSQDEKETKFDIDASGFRALTRCAVLCNRAEFRDDPGNANKPLWNRDCTGNASEAALLRFYEEHVGGSTNYRYNNPKVTEVPFTPVNKFQLSIHTTDDGDERFLLVIKGAPEVVLQRCTTIFVDGRELPLTGDWHDVFMDAYHDMGSNGERVLGFADFRLPRRDFPRNYRFAVEEIENLSQFNFPMNGFRFLGLIAMHDPPRPSVPDAVKKCRSAGIKVIMITGDHPITAKAIAKQVGIISEGSETVEDIALRLRVPVEQVNRWDAKACVIHGSELKGMSVNDLDDILSHYDEIVIARTSPQQKLIIVEGCQRQGAIVAVTGDGVNDSPALKQADIGIAMGISGSDVSKQAADMILLDDDFASIVTGVEEGRLIFDNLKKTIAYAITSNVPEIAPFFMFLVTDIPFALGTITILCIDLGTDLYPAISLAYEEPESDIMKRKPRDPDSDRLINRMLVSLTYGQIGMIQASAGFFAYFVALAENGFWPSRLVGIRRFWDSHGIHDLQDSYGQEWSYDQRKDLERTGYAAFFFAIVVVQWANLLICRTRRLSMFQQRFRNWHILGALAFETCLAILIIFVPYLNRVLSCQQLMFLWMLPALPYAIAIVVYDEVRKVLIRKNPGGWLEDETYY